MEKQKHNCNEHIEVITKMIYTNCKIKDGIIQTPNFYDLDSEAKCGKCNKDIKNNEINF